MRLTQLSLENYRGFAAQTIAFDPRLTVLIGANGAGKSSVLDALHILLTQYSARLVGSPSSASRLQETDIRHGAEEARLQLQAHDDLEGDVSWTVVKRGARQRVLKPSAGSNLTGLNDFTKAIAARSDPDAFLHGEVAPIYYDQRRAILKIPQRHRTKAESGALAVFWDSLSGWGIDFPRLSSWFKDRESDELRRQKLRPKFVDRELEAVRRAMTTATGFRNPYFSVDKPRGLTFTKRKVNLHISQLSTGEQVFLALAGDLARRLAGLAEGDTDPLDVSAIVLIDEVELHLHPVWQRTIIPWLLETFPQCQFVVSTHSPQVVSEVEAVHLRILQDRPTGTRILPATASFGRDSNHLLVSLFDVPIRRSATDKLIKQADVAMTEGELEKAGKLISRLKSQIEGGAPEVAVLEARLARRANAL